VRAKFIKGLSIMRSKDYVDEYAVRSTRLHRRQNSTGSSVSCVAKNHVDEYAVRSTRLHRRQNSTGSSVLCVARNYIDEYAVRSTRLHRRQNSTGSSVSCVWQEIILMNMPYAVPCKKAKDKLRRSFTSSPLGGRELS